MTNDNLPIENFSALGKVEGEGSPSPQEQLLDFEVKKTLALSQQYKSLEESLLDRMRDMVDMDDDLTATNLMGLVKALKELRAIAPSPTVLPQQENKQPTIQIQFLNSNQITVN